MKLLIVDDTSVMRSFLRELCVGIACEMAEACDGEEALEMHRQFQPDWTLMDIAMPVIDGLTATIRILESRPGARILLLSENGGHEYEIAARIAGARAFLCKDDLHRLPALLKAAS